ncbi:MAG: hypothetical protein HXY43_23975 [Fischerella sp.]|jgi:hypothetical protein|uniref:hypothetical protein n=1 Tax=unclassified Fischerella TaxID=494603 RepID=UPI00047DA4F0|nr:MULTISPECIES: hypothetical protein [unclassified Fischerella]NWF62227.1 hypothetical protein [Fischerella sp.]
MNNNKLRNILIGAGVAAVGAIGTKAAVDYFRNRGKEEVVDESQGDAVATSPQEVAYATVETNSVQGFLDKSFGEAGRYVPNRPPKIFDYQGNQYMVIWAYDNKQQKNQMLAFLYTDAGRKMIASVGYTNQKTDYNLNLGSTPFAVEVNGQQLRSGQSETGGTSDVDFVLAGS